MKLQTFYQRYAARNTSSILSGFEAYFSVKQRVSGSPPESFCQEFNYTSVKIESTFNELFNHNNKTSPIFDRIEALLPEIALQKAFISSNRRSTLIYIYTSEIGTESTFKLVEELRKLLETIQTNSHSASLTGYDPVLCDVQQGTRDDMKVMDLVSLPLALLVLLLVLKYVFKLCFGFVVPWHQFSSLGFSSIENIELIKVVVRDYDLHIL